MYHLVVRSAFGGYAVGDMITDGTTVAAVLSDPHKRSLVVRLKAPEPVQIAPAPGGGAYITQAPPEAAPEPAHGAGAP